MLRSFAAHSLLNQDTVLGIEANFLSFLHTPFNDDEMHPKGLCNAVIVARKGAVFLERWLESYEGFNEGKWTEHSVVSSSRHDMKYRLVIWISVAEMVLNLITLQPVTRC